MLVKRLRKSRDKISAAAGFGIAYVPCWLVGDRLRSGDLVQLLEDEPGQLFDTHAVWPKTPHLNLRVRIAIDALAAELPNAIKL
jgi:DNA-binding transcriptional LysR family regulator